MSYDLYFEGSPTKSRAVSLGYRASVAVQGFPKLITRWTKCLLTLKGSDPFSLNEGTYFNNMSGMNVFEEADVYDAAALAIDDCNQQIQAWDQVNMPPLAEQFRSAAITRVEAVLADRYDIWVRITNAAGQAATLVVAGTGA